jgi:hypothetical protein
MLFYPEETVTSSVTAAAATEVNFFEQREAISNEDKVSVMDRIYVEICERCQSCNFF